MLAWFSISPLGTGSGSVSAEVARAVAAVEATGIPSRTDASGTTVEGTWEECLAAVRAGSEAVLDSAPRVSVTCKLDIRSDKPDWSIADKEASLRRARDAA